MYSQVSIYGVNMVLLGRVGWETNGCDGQCYSVSIWIWANPFFFLFFSQHICLQAFASSSMIGQNALQAPEVCKLMQIFVDYYKDENWGPLVISPEISCWEII